MEQFEITPLALVNLAFFLLPGFLFMYSFFYQIPDRKKSDFTIILISVIFSVVLNFLTSWVFGVISLITHLKLASTSSDLWSEWISSITHLQWNIQPNNPYTTWVSIFIGIFLSIVLARILQSENAVVSFINSKLFRVEEYHFGTMWNAFLKTGSDSFVKVTTQRGTIYIGKVGRVSNEAEGDMQAIELLKPFIYRKSNNSLVRIIETEKMMVQGNSIVSIEQLTEDKAQELYFL